MTSIPVSEVMMIELIKTDFPKYVEFVNQLQHLHHQSREQVEQLQEQLKNEQLQQKEMQERMSRLQSDYLNLCSQCQTNSRTLLLKVVQHFTINDHSATEFIQSDLLEQVLETVEEVFRQFYQDPVLYADEISLCLQFLRHLLKTDRGRLHPKLLNESIINKLKSAIAIGSNSVLDDALASISSIASTDSGLHWLCSNNIASTLLNIFSHSDDKLGSISGETLRKSTQVFQLLLKRSNYEVFLQKSSMEAFNIFKRFAQSHDRYVASTARTMHKEYQQVLRQKQAIHCTDDV